MTERPRIFRGIGASPGVAIGKVFLLNRGRVRVPRQHIEPDQLQHESVRLSTAIDRSVEQLEAIRGRFIGDGMDHQSILEAHEMMLRDPSLFDEAKQLIHDEQINAEWAVSKVVARVSDFFDRIPDEYMRERGGDVDFVGERIIRNLVGKEVDLTEVLRRLGGNAIVVAHDLSPADTALLCRYHIAAFVTEMGGKTSHTSIVARSLDVPAVVGASGIFEAAGTGDPIVVDGLEGTIMLRPSQAQLARGEQRAAQFKRVNLDLLDARAQPARTIDGCDVRVVGNIELPAEIRGVLGRGGEGVGLYRTEFMFLGRREAPDEEEHFHTYCELFHDLGSRPVTIRTLDLGGEKNIGPVIVGHEPNPALGLRAIRYCLQNLPIFEAQVAGILRAAAQGNVRIMLPMISGIDELRRAREIIESVADRLKAEGKEYRRDVPIGIMVEIPSAVMTADLLAEESDFFSVGTNDLMQYLLAIDRTNERVAYLYHPLHPAMLRTLQIIATAASAANIPVSICGEMAGEAVHTAILLGLGFTELSMNASSIPRVKRAIRELRHEDCGMLLREALGCHTPSEVETVVNAFLAAKVRPTAPA